MELVRRRHVLADRGSRGMLCSLYCLQSQPPAQGPYRLVVRTPRCGCDNPGSTPGEGMYAMFHGGNLCFMDAEQPNVQEEAR